MEKAPEAFRIISEVATELDVPQHVLRFWESRFPQVKPMKRGGGRRYYRPDDVELLRGIRHMLYSEGYTIRGVQRIFREQGVRFVQNVWKDGAPQPERASTEEEEAPARGVFGLLPGFGKSSDEREDRIPEEAAAAPPVGAVLPQDTIDRLEAVLDELAECKRLLDAAHDGGN
jgi:DNA-binding transcriptional MerR regulator